MNAPESFDDPLPVLPGVVVFGVLWQNDFGQPKLVARILKPVHQNSAVLPEKLTKTAKMKLAWKMKIQGWNKKTRNDGSQKSESYIMKDQILFELWAMIRFELGT